MIELVEQRGPIWFIWHDEHLQDPRQTSPIDLNLPDADENEARIAASAIIVRRAEESAVERKLQAVSRAEDMIINKVASLMDAARDYIREHPNVTGEQLKTALAQQFKQWASTWVGD